MFGGDQLHPAYCPRKLEPNEVLIGNELYTIMFEKDRFVRVSHEHIDGRSGQLWSGFLDPSGAVPSYISTAYVPELVRRKIKRLFVKQSKERPKKKVRGVLHKKPKRSI